ncbi:MAG: hypothetical protein ACOCXA_04915 [Planctomycetota bacterium]
MGAFSYDQVLEYLKSNEIDDETKIRVIRTGEVFKASELEPEKDLLPRSSRKAGSHATLILGIVLLLPPAFVLAFTVQMGLAIAAIQPVGWIIAVIPFITGLILTSRFMKGPV